MLERTIPTVLVGGNFKGAVAIDAMSRMTTGSVIKLQREPDNPKDPRAVACYFLNTHVGYIPRQTNPRIAEALDRGAPVNCTVAAPPVIKGSRVVVEPKLTVSYWQPTS